MQPYQRLPEGARFADAFAQFFLMPTSGRMRRFNDLRRAKDRVTLGDLCTLARYYGVSLESLLRRLEGLRLTGFGKADSLRQSGLLVTEAKGQYDLTEVPVKDDRLPTRYQYLALDAYQQERIGEGQFARFLGVDRLEARRIATALQQPELPFLPDHEAQEGAAASTDVQEEP